MTDTDDVSAPDRPRVSLPTRVAFGAGSVAFGVKDNGFSYFLLIYYNQVLGLPATAAGAALMIALVLDAFSDPIVGYVSDHWHSRWGRRHPFMYAAALPLAVGYFLIWNPPSGLGEGELFAYLLVGVIAIRTLITFYEIPSSSLVPELSSDYVERTSLLSFRFFFGWYGGLTMAVLAYTVFLKASPDYPNGVLNPAGYGIFGFIGAVAMLVSILISSVGTHRYIPQLRQPPPKRSIRFGLIYGELLQTLSNRPFLALFGGGLFLAMGIGITASLQIYLTTFFWELEPGEIATIVGFQFLSALIAPLAAPVLTRRFEKKQAAIGLAMFAIFFGAAPVLLRLVGFFPPNGSPWLLPILRAHGLIEVTVFIMVSITLSSMVADVVEENEIATGRREEGLFFAARNFALKATSGLGTFLAGVGLDLIRFPKGAAPGSLAPDVLVRFGLLMGPVLMLVYLISLLFLRGYRITRSGHERNLAILMARHQGE
jgi:Na+/melibiose symporter-like transporter